MPSTSPENYLLLPCIAKGYTNHLLSDLLPYELGKKRHSDISRGLNEYRALLNAGTQAFNALLCGNLSQFDSLVGENSCQIRAVMIFLISEFPMLDVHGKIQTLQKNIAKIDHLLGNLEKRNSASLDTAIREHDLQLELNFAEAFLISSFLLTHIRVIMPPDPENQIVRNEHTDVQKIKAFGTFGTTFARDLVKSLRSFVAKASVQFVQEVADLLAVPDSYAEMVSNKYRIEYSKFGRLECLPCFWYSLILTKYAIAIELPLVIKLSQLATDKEYKTLEETSLYYKVINGKYQAVRRSEIPSDSPTLIILGSSCRKASDFPEASI